MIVVRRGDLVDVWYGGQVDDPESDFVGTFHYTLCKELIAALKRFEQQEGRL